MLIQVNALQIHSRYSAYSKNRKTYIKLKHRYDDTSVAKKLKMKTTARKLQKLQRQIRTIFDKHKKDCINCENCCCFGGTGDYYKQEDMIYLIVKETKLPHPIKMTIDTKNEYKLPCVYLTKNGCGFATDRRSKTCMFHTCKTLVNAMDTKEINKLNKLKAKYSKLLSKLFFDFPSVKQHENKR